MPFIYELFLGFCTKIQVEYIAYYLVPPPPGIHVMTIFLSSKFFSADKSIYSIFFSSVVVLVEHYSRRTAGREGIR